MERLQKQIGAEFGEETDSAIISAIQWVPTTAFKRDPQHYSDEEMRLMQQEYQRQEAEKRSTSLRDIIAVEKEDSSTAAHDDERQHDPDDDSDDDAQNDDDEDDGMKDGKKHSIYQNFQQEFLSSLIGNPGMDTYFKEGDVDPNLKDQEDSDSEEDDMRIYESDNIALAIYNEEFVSTLQVHVYEPEENNCFLHHDFMLSNHGLCVEWIGYPRQALSSAEHQGKATNCCAIGTMDPHIEIWDLDIIDPIEPVAVLGDPEITSSVGKQKQKQKNKKVQNTNTHTGPVLSLSWNRGAKQFLASGSEDKTVRVWDLEKLATVCTLSHHKGPVHNVLWRPNHVNLLLTGSFDRTSTLLDPRQVQSAIKFKLEGSDITAMQWAPYCDNLFVAGFESGAVSFYDIRMSSASGTPFIRFNPHTAAITDISFYPKMSNVMITSSEDCNVRFWRVNQDNSCLLLKSHSYKKKVFCAHANDNYVITGSENGKIRVDNLDEVCVQPKKQFQKEMEQQEQ